MELTLNNTPVATAQADCLVLGFTEGGKLTPSAQAIDDATGGAIQRLLESRDIDTGIGKAHFLHGLDGVAAPRILAVGFGKQEKLDLPRFDRACLAAARGELPGVRRTQYSGPPPVMRACRAKAAKPGRVKARVISRARSARKLKKKMPSPSLTTPAGVP